MKQKHLGIALSALAAIALAGCAGHSAPGPSATAKLEPTRGNTTAGTVSFVQSGDLVKVSGTITGLKPGAEHGFHVHEKGDCSAVDAMSAGAHFNPFVATHGRANVGAHHSGDMDNVVADAEGVAQLNIHLAGVTLGGGAVNDIAGRALVVHASADDYTSQPAGNAGARVACGVINATQ